MKKQEKLIKVFTVIPYNEGLSTQHFKLKVDADNWAKTYKDGAMVVENELPQRVIDAKDNRTARYGYGL